jgi:hypothetical protein
MEAYVMPNQVIDNSTPLTVFQVCGTQLWSSWSDQAVACHVYICVYMIIFYVTIIDRYHLLACLLY